VSVEVPADVVTRETESVVQNYQKLARLPGFRKGKVPMTVVRTRFADDIRGEVVERLVPRYFREAVAQQHLEPISQPQVTDLHLKDGEPMRFKATFEVLPPIQVTGYQELRAEKPDTSISEEEVATEMNNLRERRAVFVPVEGRALADGDFADISFSGIPKEEGAKPIRVDDIMVHIGGPDTVKEFSENLRGANAGEERTFDVAYAADFSDPRLAGKTVEYKVEIRSIKQKNLPELTDDFARSLGDFENLEALKQKLREGMEAEKKHNAEHEAKEKLIDELVRRNEFPVPESMVDHQIDMRLQRGLRALAAQGLSTEQMKKMDLPRLRAGQRDAAVKEVKASLILENIAEAEKIEVSDEEIGNEIDALARQTKQSSDEIRSRLTRDGALDRIRNRIRNEKALDLLYRRSA
jgi:trigger factor